MILGPPFTVKGPHGCDNHAALWLVGRPKRPTRPLWPLPKFLITSLSLIHTKRWVMVMGCRVVQQCGSVIQMSTLSPAKQRVAGMHRNTYLTTVEKLLCCHAISREVKTCKQRTVLAFGSFVLRGWSPAYVIGHCNMTSGCISPEVIFTVCHFRLQCKLRICWTFTRLHVAASVYYLMW